jgi:acetolactate synthase-1/2/3 large subunit
MMSKTAAQLMAEFARKAGIDLVLANSGTTEVQFVGAFAPEFSDRFQLCLHEDVCTGAADGYARISGKPAIVNLHLGPGLAHGLSNIHNARRAGSPMVLVIGDHDVAHRDADAPLTSDIETLARPFCKWIRTMRDPSYAARDLADAIHASLYPTPGVAALVAPNDLLGTGVEQPRHAAFEPIETPVAEHSVLVRLMDALKAASNPLIVVGGKAAGEEGMVAAHKLASAVGASVIAEPFPPVLARGGSIPPVKRLSYPGPVARRELEPHDLVLVAGVRDLTPFFSDGIDRSFIRDGSREVWVADLEPPLPGTKAVWGDPVKTLVWLAEESGGKLSEVKEVSATGSAVGKGIAEGLVDGSIVVDEAITNTLGLYSALDAAPRHDYLAIKGGSLGAGIPIGLGCALADPSRKVVIAVGDGSACYSIQALWNIARLGADVTVVVFNNASYDIIAYELSRAGYAPPPKQAVKLEPRVDFAKLAEGQGMSAVRLESADPAAISEAVAAKEPILVDVVVPSMFPA